MTKAFRRYVEAVQAAAGATPQHDLEAALTLAVQVMGHERGPDVDASLAACKSLTASWYAQHHGIPLTGVDIQVERDDSREKQGEYKLKVKMELHGPLTLLRGYSD